MKTIKKNFIQVNDIDLDESITDFLKSKGYDILRYESVAENEWNNYSSYQFEIDGEIDEWDKKSIDSNQWGELSMLGILNLMAKEGLIEKGDYLISVCW